MTSFLINDKIVAITKACSKWINLSFGTGKQTRELQVWQSSIQMIAQRYIRMRMN